MTTQIQSNDGWYKGLYGSAYSCYFDLVLDIVTFVCVRECVWLMWFSISMYMCVYLYLYVTVTSSFVTNYVVIF